MVVVVVVGGGVGATVVVTGGRAGEECFYRGLTGFHLLSQDFLTMMVSSIANPPS